MVRAVSLNAGMKEKATIFFPGKVDDSILTFFLTHGESVNLAKGDTVPKKTLINSFVFLREGLLFYTTRTNNYSKPKFITVIFPNRLADYHLLFDDNCTCCKGICAARDSEIIVINKQKIRELVQTRPDLFSQFTLDAAYYTERQTTLAVFLLTSSPEDKLLKFLFDTLVVLDTDFSQQWLTVHLKLTRQEIAEILHISVIKLDLMLGELKKQGLVRRVGNKLQVRVDYFHPLSPCPLGREDANGCQSNNMSKFRAGNLITLNNGG